MKLTELIKPSYKVYDECAQVAREWVEKTYTGLSLDFYPRMEIVATSSLADYSGERVQKITESVNIKIGEIMEKRAEEIVLAERVERIRKKHPRFNPEIESVDELKKLPQFLAYFKELIINKQGGAHKKCKM